MLNPKILLIIIGAVTALGLTLLAIQWWIIGGLITAIGLAFLYIWWRMNQLLEVNNALSTNDFETARRKLAAIRNPEKLNPYSKTYYYFFAGVTEIRANNMKGARQNFKTALETNRFRAVDEKAMALLMMAQLDIRSRNNEGAKRYLREAKELNPSPQIKEQINDVVKQARLRL